jgi:hypothetical protein
MAGLYLEDEAIASVIMNDSKLAFYGSIGKAAAQDGTYGNTNKIFTTSVLTGSLDSPECKDILAAMNAAIYVLENGSQLPAYYDHWAGALQGGRVVSPKGYAIQINDTIFYH